MNFELLLVKDKGDFWKVIGITYSNAMMVEPDCFTLRASLLTIETCKKYLTEGKNIIIDKKIEYSEVQPHNLIINELSELDSKKQRAINEICARMHAAVFAISVIDLMDYLNCYINLINAGYFITDSNRDDKYFEIIEKSQSVAAPEPLKENASFEDEQKFFEQKQQYDDAQNNLLILEKYLNAYDKLSSIKNIINILSDTRDKIQNAQSIEEINTILKIYHTTVTNYKMVN